MIPKPANFPDILEESSQHQAESRRGHHAHKHASFRALYSCVPTQLSPKEQKKIPISTIQKRVIPTSNLNFKPHTTK